MTALHRTLAIGLALTLGAAAARADDEAAKREAKALLREGNRLLQEARDPAGALELFLSAYDKFPSPKILLSIGSAERELGHAAAAANAYARFLESPDATGDQATEARRLLGELDRALGRVRVRVAPAGAELRLGDGRWQPADALAEWRAAPGPLEVAARAAGHDDGRGTVTVVAGRVVELAITLTPTAAPPPSSPPSRDVPDAPPAAEPARGPGRLGILGKLIVDGEGRGAGGVVGGVVGLGPVALDLAAIVGPTFGAYGGVHVGLGGGRLRPVLGVGVPVFFDDGARIGARAAGGLEYRLSPRLRMSLEVGAEYMLTRADDIDRWVLAPALAAEARL